MKLEKFSEVALKYKAIFFDSFGVLKNYKGIIPGIENTFEFLKEQGIAFYVLTNDASRSPQQLSDAFFNIGLTNITPDRIISSGMLANDYLKAKVKSGTVAYLGTDNSGSYIKEETGLDVIAVDKIDFEDISDISALVFLDDEGYSWDQGINNAVNLLRKKNIPAVVANTDATYPVAKHDVAVAIGAIANMVEAVTDKHFIRFGKPDAQMFNFAYQHINQDLPFAKEDVLMVGDTLTTDIIGGNKFGLDTVLVLTGNVIHEKARLLVRTSGIAPTYICESAIIPTPVAQK